MEQTFRSAIPIPANDPQVSLGDVSFLANVSNIDVARRIYILATWVRYPDGSRIHYSETVVATSITRRVEGMLAQPVTVRTDIAVIGRRIEIRVNGRLFYSIDLSRGDRCIQLMSEESFTYSGNSIVVPSQTPSRYDDINLLYGVEPTGTVSFSNNAPAAFTGPLLLCISGSRNQAFYTRVDSLRTDIMDAIMTIQRNATAPQLRDVPSETVRIVDIASGVAQVGQTVIIRVGRAVLLRVILDQEGEPSPPQIFWFLNGQPLVTNSRVGLSPDRRMLFISDAQISNAGLYQSIVRNPAGAGEDTDTTNLIVQPNREYNDRSTL